MRAGDRVTGRYFGREFTGKIIERMSTEGREELTIELDKPITLEQPGGRATVVRMIDTSSSELARSPHKVSVRLLQD